MKMLDVLCVILLSGVSIESQAQVLPTDKEILVEYGKQIGEYFYLYYEPYYIGDYTYSNPFETLYLHKLAYANLSTDHSNMTFPYGIFYDSTNHQISHLATQQVDYIYFTTDFVYYFGSIRYQGSANGTIGYIQLIESTILADFKNAQINATTTPANVGPINWEITNPDANTQLALNVLGENTVKAIIEPKLRYVVIEIGFILVKKLALCGTETMKPSFDCLV